MPAVGAIGQRRLAEGAPRDGLRDSVHPLAHVERLAHVGDALADQQHVVHGERLAGQRGNEVGHEGHVGGAVAEEADAGGVHGVVEAGRLFDPAPAPVLLRAVLAIGRALCLAKPGGTVYWQAWVCRPGVASSW